MKARPGMSLVEVLLAIVLVGMIALGLYAFLARIGSAREQVALAAQRDHAVSVFLGLVEEDLLGAVVELPGIGAGVKGTATELSLVGFGVTVDPESADASRSDVVRSTYRFASGRLVVTRAGLNGETVLENAGRVRFRYHDGRTWLSTFDSSAANRLPVAVEIAVWLTKPEGVDAATTVPSDRADQGDPSEPDVMSDAAREDGGLEAPAGDGEPWPPPDRLRVIVVPDAPDAGWPTSESSGEGAEP
jgi:prepilin-type N-terminal cleavage/methylation domain-containing protein